MRERESCNSLSDQAGSTREPCGINGFPETLSPCKGEGSGINWTTVATIYPGEPAVWPLEYHELVDYHEAAAAAWPEGSAKRELHYRLAGIARQAKSAHRP